jgi:hypothetical protein
MELFGVISDLDPKPLINLLEQTTSVDLKWKIAGSYSKSNGKFPLAYGTVVVADCSYIFDQMVNAAFKAIAPL